MDKTLHLNDVYIALMLFFYEHGRWVASGSKDMDVSLKVGSEILSPRVLNHRLKTGKAILSSGSYETTTISKITDELKSEWLACQSIPHFVGYKGARPIKLQQSDFALSEIREALLDFYKKSGRWVKASGVERRTWLTVNGEKIMVSTINTCLRDGTRGLPKGCSISKITKTLKAEEDERVKVSVRNSMPSLY